MEDEFDYDQLITFSFLSTPTKVAKAMNKYGRKGTLHINNRHIDFTGWSDFDSCEKMTICDISEFSEEEKTEIRKIFATFNSYTFSDYFVQLHPKIRPENSIVIDLVCEHGKVVSWTWKGAYREDLKISILR